MSSIELIEVIIPGPVGPPGPESNANLSINNRLADTLDIASSTGDDVTVPSATNELSGLMTASDKIRVDSSVNLLTLSGSDLVNTIGTNMPGTNVTLLGASPVSAGLLIASDKIKLNNLVAIASSGSASDLIAGTLPNARLSAQVVRNDLSYSDPAWITALAASKITGTFMKSQQHAQTAYLDQANTFSQPLTARMNFASDVWHTSQNDASNRMFFATNSVTFLRSPAGFRFRNANTEQDTIEFSESGAASFNGPVSFANGVWNKSADNQDRLLFQTNSNTYYRCAGSGSHIFRTGSESDAFEINSSGNVIANAATFNGVATFVDAGGGSFRIDGRSVSFPGTDGNFATSNSFIFTAASATPYIFRNGSGVDLLTLSSAGAATLRGPVVVNNAGQGRVVYGPDSYIEAGTVDFIVRHLGSGSIYQDFGSSVIFRRTSDYATMMTLSNTGAATFTGPITSSSGNSFFNGLRLNGADTNHTVYNGNQSLGVVVETGHSVYVGRTGWGHGLTVNTTTGHVTTSHGATFNGGTVQINSTAINHAILKLGSVTYLGWDSSVGHNPNDAYTHFYNRYIGDATYGGWKFQNLVGSTVTTKAEIKGNGDFVANGATFNGAVRASFGLIYVGPNSNWILESGNTLYFDSNGGGVAFRNATTAAAYLTVSNGGNAIFGGHITSTFSSSTSDLSTLDLSAGQTRLHKNTLTNDLKLFANDGGTIKTVTLT